MALRNERPMPCPSPWFCSPQSTLHLLYYIKENLARSFVWKRPRRPKGGVSPSQRYAMPRVHKNVQQILHCMWMHHYIVEEFVGHFEKGSAWSCGQFIFQNALHCFLLFPQWISRPKKVPKKNPLKFVLFLLWVMPEATGMGNSQPCLGFTLCKPLLL